MLRKVTESALLAIAGALVSLALGFVGNLIASPDGYIRQHGTVLVSGHEFIDIEIENSSNHFIDGLVMKLNYRLEAGEVSKSDPVTIDLVGHFRTTTELKIGAIKPTSSVHLFIPSDPSNRGQDAITFVNLDEKKLRIVKGPLGDAIQQKDISLLASTAAIYAVLLFIASLYGRLLQDRSDRRHAERVEESRTAFLEKMKEVEANGKAIRELKNDLSIEKHNSRKISLLLRARLRDYETELQFWRNTIRAILISGGEKDRHVSDRLFDIITNELKTFQINRKNDFEFESVNVLAKLVVDYEKKIDDPKDRQS